MKTIFALITFAALSIGSSFAQNSNNDPQMSVNNYKHANKAKKAAQTDTRASRLFRIEKNIYESVLLYRCLSMCSLIFFK